MQSSVFALGHRIELAIIVARIVVPCAIIHDLADRNYFRAALVSTGQKFNRDSEHISVTQTISQLGRMCPQIFIDTLLTGVTRDRRCWKTEEGTWV